MRRFYKPSLWIPQHFLVTNPNLHHGLLGMVDAVRQMLKEIKSTGQDGDVDYPELRETLTRLQTPAEANAAITPPPLPVSSTPKPPTTPEISASAQAKLTPPPPTETAPLVELAPPAGPRQKRDDGPRKPSRGKIGGLLVERGLVQASDIARALEEQEHGDRRRLGESLWLSGWQNPKTFWRPSKLSKPNRATPRLKPFASESTCWISS